MPFTDIDIPLWVYRAERMSTASTVSGMHFVRNNEGRPFASDNDVALWTGVALAQRCFAYMCDSSGERLRDIHTSLSGVNQLVNGYAPGILARWAFPLGNSWGRIGYHREKSLAVPGNTFGDRIREGNLYEKDEYAYEFRTTRDQLGGIMLGLAAAMQIPEVKGRAKQIFKPLYIKLERNGWSLRDHTGSTGGTSAHRADSANRLVLKSMAYACGLVDSRPSSLWMRLMPWPVFYYNRKTTNAYSFLLNSLDCLSLYLLRQYHKEEAGVRRWWRAIYRQMADDENPHFSAVNVAVDWHQAWFDTAKLERLSREPHSGSYMWNREPEDWFQTGKSTIGGGLDVLFPFYLNRYCERLYR